MCEAEHSQGDKTMEQEHRVVVHTLGMVGDQRVWDTGHMTPFSYFRKQDVTMVGPTPDSQALGIKACHF